MKEILNYIKQSIYDKDGKVSATKISSYVILGGILTNSAVFIGIDIVNAILSWNKGLSYIIPPSHIGIFSLILTHHLILLGLKKMGEQPPVQPDSKVPDNPDSID